MEAGESDQKSRGFCLNMEPLNNFYIDKANLALDILRFTVFLVAAHIYEKIIWSYLISKRWELNSALRALELNMLYKAYSNESPLKFLNPLFQFSQCRPA